MALDTVVYNLIKAMIGAETLIFADQNAPRPPLPYWTVLTQTNKQLGSATYSQGVTLAGDQEVRGVREATVRLQRMGEGSFTAVSDVRDDVSRLTVLENWQRQKISLYNVGDVQNVPFLMDKASLEPRATLDLFIRHGTSLLDRVSAIETVEASASYVGKPDLNETITIVLP